MTKSYTPYIIWWAIALHVAWGVALVVDPEVLPIAILVGLHWIAGLGLSGPAIGAVLVGAAILAGAGLVLDHRLSSRVALSLLMPQYALLITSLISDAQSVITGTVSGRPVDRPLLFVALCPIMIAAVLHSFAIVERHLLWNRPR